MNGRRGAEAYINLPRYFFIINASGPVNIQS
jgi:hypothetical protein